MKKLKSLLLLLLALIMSISCFAGCEEAPPSEEPDPDPAPTVQTAEEAYALLRTSYAKMFTLLATSKAFTAWDNTIQSGQFELDEENTDLGETNADGNAWASEAEKTEAVNSFKQLLENESYSGTDYYNKISYDGENEIGYDIYRDDNSEDSASYDLFRNETDGYYVYLLNSDYSDGKYTVFDDYEIQLRNTARNTIFNEYQFLFEKTTLDEAIVYIQEETVALTEPTVAFTSDNGVYTLSFTSEESSENESYKQIFELTFTADSLITIRDREEGIATLNERINNSAESGSLAISYTYLYDCEIGFSTTYDADECPSLDIFGDSEDLGNLPINIEYYIGGHYLFNSSSMVYAGDEVVPFDTEAGTGLKSDLQWYLDEECTIPFTATTYPSYSFNLYAKDFDVCKEGYAVVALTSYNSEETYLQALADDNVVYSYFYVWQIERAPLDSDWYVCTYINGTRYTPESASIPLTPGILNYVVNIFH